MLKDFQRTVEHIFKGMGTLPEEGKKLVWLGIYVALGGIVAAFWAGWDGLDVAVFGALFAGFSMFFFRDPERNVSFSPDEIVCPADGRVMTIRTESDPGVLVIRIFLSVFDVHIQRSTMDGTIGEITYTKGKFAVASKEEAALNERNLIRISDPNKFAHVEQITGAIARRIACWVKPGQTVKAGEKIGLIYFGSQAAIYLPAKSVRVLVHPGQKVEGGLTVLGLWK